MKNLFRISIVVAACLVVVSGLQVRAQNDQPMGQPGQMQGQGRAGRGGFGGGQMGQPVQGSVTAVAKDKLTIKTDAGDSYDVSVTDNSRIMRGGQQIKLSDIKPGDQVTARGTVDAAKKTVEAMMVMDIDAATLAKAKENMGKTYIIGRITAIDADNLKITVMRTDNVSQVIAVDDGTSFQRGNRGVSADVAAAGGIVGGGFGGGFGGGRGMGGGRQGGGAQATPPPPESITLADIKVGDSVMATGTLKDGTFTALKMGVSGAGPGGGGAGRGRGANGQGMPPGAPPPPPPASAPPQQ